MIVYIAQSLDGYIADSDNSLEWLFKHDEKIFNSDDEIKNSYTNFIKDIDVIVNGKKTYDFLVNDMGIENPYKEYENYLITNKEVVDSTITNVLNLDELLKIDFKDKKVWVVGGGEIIKQFMDKGLINKLIITTIPEIIGGGVPLFSTTTKSSWKLINVCSSNDYVESCYIKEKEC